MRQSAADEKAVARAVIAILLVVEMLDADRHAVAPGPGRREVFHRGHAVSTLLPLPVRPKRLLASGTSIPMYHPAVALCGVRRLVIHLGAWS